jgi:NAD(P)-dependent dehydrogenase (short-subunit alcohol dehydrogenase family)
MKNRFPLVFAAAIGGCIAVRQIRKSPRISLQGKVALITGGSRGLGLATAREFGSRGAVIAICARNEEELGRATEDLRFRGFQAHYFVCDVTNRECVAGMIADITALLGPVDILVNNAGIIKVGPFLSMELADFEEAMNVMFWGMLTPH